MNQSQADWMAAPETERSLDEVEACAPSLASEPDERGEADKAAAEIAASPSAMCADEGSAPPVQAAAPAPEAHSPEPKIPPRETRAFAARTRARPAAWRRIDAFQAAGVVVALGIGWIAGANMVYDRSDVARLQSQVSSLRGKVAAIAALKARAAPISEIRSLREGEARLGVEIHAQKIRLDQSDERAQNRFAKTAAEIDRIEKDNRLTEIKARVGRLERRLSSRDTTASIPVVSRAASPRPPAAVVTPASAVGPGFAPSSSSIRVEGDHALPQTNSAIPATGYVLRDVYRGEALVQSRDGMRVIAPGDRLPGAGRVIRIARRGGGWIVVTSGGVIDANKY